MSFKSVAAVALLFLLGATAHAQKIIRLYQGAAKKAAEIHIFSKGGHGFGMRKQNLPSDQWIERFGDWLQVQGLLKK